MQVRGGFRVSAIQGFQGFRDQLVYGQDLRGVWQVVCCRVGGGLAWSYCSALLQVFGRRLGNY